MPSVAIPTGSDLATYMARSDPGDFDLEVAEAYRYVAELCLMDPFTEMHRKAVLAQAALQVEDRGKEGGVVTDMGRVYAARYTAAMSRLKTTDAVGGFA